jgi:Universal stress protein family
MTAKQLRVSRQSIVIAAALTAFVVGGLSFVPDNRRFVTQSVLDAGVRRLQGAGWTVTNDVRYGNPAEQIVLSAREMNADLIVVGHRDQGTLARWLNESVGASILHHPPCSMLVAVKSEQQKNNVTPIRKTQARARHYIDKTACHTFVRFEFRSLRQARARPASNRPPIFHLDRFLRPYVA